MVPNVQLGGFTMKQGFRAFLMRTLVIMVFLLSAGGFNLRALEQESAAPNTPPKELVQYIRDARKAGLNEFQIQQNAVNSGWPQGLVTDAITYVHSTDKDGDAPPKAAVHDKDAT